MKQSQAGRPFPPGWTQLPGASWAGLKARQGVSDCFLAPPLPRSPRGSGTKLGPVGPPRRESLMHSFHHRILSVCCVPALSQASRTQKCTGESLPGKVHGDTPCDRKQQQRGKYSVQTHTGDRAGRECSGYGESLPLTFRPSSPLRKLRVTLGKSSYPHEEPGITTAGHD